MITNKRSSGRIAGVAVAAGLMVGLVHPSIWAAGPAGPGAAGARATHVVAPGETLWSIAGHYGPKRDPRKYIYDLEQLNNLGSAPIYPGETLALP